MDKVILGGQLNFQDGSSTLAGENVLRGEAGYRAIKEVPFSPGFHSLTLSEFNALWFSFRNLYSQSIPKKLDHNSIRVLLG